MTQLYRIQFRQTYQGHECDQVYHYLVETGSGASAAELGAEWYDQFNNILHNIQNVGVHDIGINVLDTFNHADWWVFPLSDTGNVGTTASGMSPFIASAITGDCVASLIRHSYKRICGVDESMMDAGNVDSDFEAAFGTYCDQYVEELSGTSAVYVPVSVRYNEADPPVPVLWSQIVTASFRKFTSQRSRGLS